MVAAATAQRQRVSLHRPFLTSPEASNLVNIFIFLLTDIGIDAFALNDTTKYTAYSNTQLKSLIQCVYHDAVATRTGST